MEEERSIFYSSWIIILSLFFFTRLYNISLFPIFSDESNYIYWAKLIDTTHQHWFISLIAGKPPVFIWAMVFFIHILPGSWYLLAGRLPAVLAGLLALLGIYRISIILFQKKTVAFTSLLLFIFTPFALFYDRLALFDGFLTATTLWAIYFTLKTAKNFSFWNAFFWGVWLGLSLLSKQNATVFILLTPICFLFISSQKGNYGKKIQLITFAILIAEVLGNLLQLSRGYKDYIRESISSRIPSISFFLHHPLFLLLPNAVQIAKWVLSLYTIPVVLFGFIGFGLLIKERKKAGFLLFILWFFPVMLTAYLGKDLYPRYILFTLPYFLIAASYAYEVIRQWNKFVFSVCVGITIVPLFVFTLLLLYNPEKTPLPQIEFSQYISGWTAGYGLVEIMHVIDTGSVHKQVTIVTIGSVSLYPYAFNLYYWDKKNIQIMPIWPVQITTRQIIENLTKKTSVYVVLKVNFNEKHPDLLQKLHLKEVFRVYKPTHTNAIIIAQPF